MNSAFSSIVALRQAWLACSSAGFLGRDVNIYCGGIAKESVDRREVWKPPPASAYGPPKYHLRDVILANEFANTFDQLAP
ncbi:MAG TPA: hypothetical protein VGM27_09675, partial [Acidobacteriaceae bacterium]